MTTKFISLIASVLVLTACSPRATLTVSNSLPVSRNGEIAETSANDIISRVGSQFVLTDSKGEEVAYQLTSDSTIIFLANVGASSSAKYMARPGVPAPVKAKTYGRKFPEHKDNMNWENDLSAYVAYGPALQASGERGFGYDVWTKSVDTLVIEERNRLRDLGKSLHRDHGNGMDAYIVANTLGAGTAALLDDKNTIIYPWAWRDYEILDNGPLRFKVKLTYNPSVIGVDSAVVEQRIISLDAGSDLNRTEVSFFELSQRHRIAPGIVIHRQNPYGDAADRRNGIIAYADSTDNATNGNGVIYIGAVVPMQNVEITYIPVSEPARDALGHILAVSEYNPGETFTYYWGAAWSKNPTGPSDNNQWLNRLRNRAQRIAAPLTVSVTR